MPRVTLVVHLPARPPEALACLTALAGLAPEPDHDVVLVDPSAGALDALLSGVEGDVAVVRPAPGTGLAEAVAAAAVARAADHVLVVLRGEARPHPGWLAALTAALAAPGVAAATSADAGAPAASPAAASSVALRAGDLAAAGGVPAAPDAHVVAALALALAGRGTVAPAPGALTDPPGPETVTAQGRYGEPVELTVVVPTLDATSERTRRCVRAIADRTPVAHEVVIVHNGAPPQGFTAPVNAGLRAARGAYAVVMNDDVEVLDGWWEPLRATLDAGAAVAFPTTVDGFNRDDEFAAWCFAVSRATLERHAAAPGAFLEPDLEVWFQDTDLLLRLQDAGCPPVAVPTARIRHAVSTTVRTEDPALRAWIEERKAADEARFRARWPHVRLVPVAVPG